VWVWVWVCKCKYGCKVGCGDVMANLQSCICFFHRGVSECDIGATVCKLEITVTWCCAYNCAGGSSSPDHPARKLCVLLVTASGKGRYNMSARHLHTHTHTHIHIHTHKHIHTHTHTYTHTLTHTVRVAAHCLYTAVQKDARWMLNGSICQAQSHYWTHK
jgi:hypothetical protein